MIWVVGIKVFFSKKNNKKELINCFVSQRRKKKFSFLFFLFKNLQIRQKKKRKLFKRNSFWSKYISVLHMRKRIIQRHTQINISRRRRNENLTIKKTFIPRKCVMYRGAMDCCVFDRFRIKNKAQKCIFGHGSLYQKCTSKLPSASVPSLLFSRIVYMWNSFNNSEPIVCIHENKLSKRSYFVCLSVFQA